MVLVSGVANNIQIKRCFFKASVAGMAKECFSVSCCLKRSWGFFYRLAHLGT
jgi:hypothetical protein